MEKNNDGASMTNFLEGKPGGLESMKTIAKLPDLVDDEKIVTVHCRGCYTLIKIKRSMIYSGDNLCEECQLDQQKRAGQEQKDKDINRLGGLKAYNQFTLSKFTNQTAVDLCTVFPSRNLFIWGAAGTGKTHLATAIIREHSGGMVLKPQTIYRQCRGIKSGEEEQAAIDGFINIPFLVIDDLGVDKRTDFSFSILYEIIDGRDMACQNGLIITSNLSLSSLAERLGDDRISSRLSGMCKIIELTGKDMRGHNG